MNVNFKLGKNVAWSIFNYYKYRTYQLDFSDPHGSPIIKAGIMTEKEYNELHEYAVNSASAIDSNYSSSRSRKDNVIYYHFPDDSILMMKLLEQYLEVIND